MRVRTLDTWRELSYEIFLMKTEIPLPVALALGVFLGFVGGFFFGRSTLPKDASMTTVGNSAARGGASSTTDGAQGVHAAGSGNIIPSDSEPLTASGLLKEINEIEPYGWSGLERFASIRRRLSSSDLPTIAHQLLEESRKAARSGGMFDASNALQLVLSALSERDPDAAWAFANSIEETDARNGAITSVLHSAAEDNPDHVLAWTAASQNEDVRMQGRLTAIRALARSNPRRALEIAIAAPDDESEQFESPITTIFSRWAAVDLPAARGALSSLNAKQTSQAVAAIANTLARTDLNAAWEFAQGMAASQTSSAPTGGYSEDARPGIVAQWAATDPQAALQAALSITDATIRAISTKSAIQTWVKSDFPAALGSALAIAEPGLRNETLSSMAYASSESDHSMLMNAIIENMPPGDDLQNAVSSIVSRWVADDPQAAARAAQALPPGRARTSAVSTVATKWMQSSKAPEEVLRWLESLPEGEARSDGIKSAIDQVSDSDPAEAARLLGRFSKDHEAAQSVIANTWGRTDPKAAMEWARQIPDPDERDSALDSVIMSWSRESPEEVAAALPTLPEQKRLPAVMMLVLSWADRDLESAAAWVDSQPRGPLKDGAVQTIASQVAEEDPESAIKWISTISDTALRVEQTEETVRDWLKTDPGTARGWIKAHLPQETQKKLLAPPK